MHAALSHRDNTEKTILLGPLDTFPALATEVTTTDAPPELIRLESGVPVRVVGASVVLSAPASTPVLTPEEERFVMKPSALLRVRRGAREALSAIRLPAVRVPRLAPAGRALLARLRGLAPAARSDLGVARKAAAGVVACARTLDPAQRRLTVGAFSAGVALASVVALIF